MKSTTDSRLAILFVTSLMFSVFVPNISEDADATYSMVVKDGLGREHTFDNIPSKIVTIGAGLTATAIELDLLDRLIVCDNYTSRDYHELFDGLRDKVESGDVRANGSSYTTGLESVITDIIYMTEKLSLVETDSVSESTITKDVAIFVTGVPASLDIIYNKLSDSDFHFQHILCWDTIDTYEDVIDMVSTMSLVMKGYIDDKVLEMNAIVDYIEKILSGEIGLERRKAFFVTYLGGELKVGNEGSIANSMIGAAGGISITTDPSKPKTYSTNISKLLEENGTDVVIFVDNSVASNQNNMDALKKALGGQDVKLVKLDPLWNNYCPESMNGVWAMACAMYADVYPDVFTGDVPVISNHYDDNVALFAIAGFASALMIGIFGFLYLRN